MRGDYTHASQNNWDNGNWHIIHLMEICCQGTIFSSSLVTTLMSAGQNLNEKNFLLAMVKIIKYNVRMITGMVKSCNQFDIPWNLGSGRFNHW